MPARQQHRRRAQEQQRVREAGVAHRPGVAAPLHRQQTARNDEPPQLAPCGLFDICRCDAHVLRALALELVRGSDRAQLPPEERPSDGRSRCAGASVLTMCPTILHT